MSNEPMRKCFVCHEWTQLPHAEFFCARCYAQPWKVRGAIEDLQSGRVKGGKARWKGTKKADRSAAAKAAALARWKTKKAPGK